MFEPTVERAYFSAYRAAFRVTYAKLVATFGPPTTNGDQDKSDAEWVIKTPDGLVMISNWRDGRAYLGPAGADIENIGYWQVKGESGRVLPWLMDTIKSPIMSVRVGE